MSRNLIPAYDLRITCEHQDQGGQHVGVSTGVTVEHIPSGIKVTVATERSQHRNKEIALDAIEGAITSPHYR
jgi:protein subunit release factor A